MRQRETDLLPVVGAAALVAGYTGASDLPAPRTHVAAPGRLLALLTLEAAAFVFMGASGKMPEVVVRLFRALLTL